MDRLFKTFLRFRFVLAGLISGLLVFLIKLIVDYVYFNPNNLGPLSLLIVQFKIPQQFFDYSLLVFGTVIIMALLGLTYGRLMRTRNIAFKDDLTGAFNKRYLQETEKRLKKKKDIFTLAMIDLDNFKQVNDTFGHEAGDEALKRIYKIFEEEKRVQDTIIRYGGDEFVMVLPSTTTSGAKKLLKRMRKKVSKIKYGKIKLGFSLGVVLERSGRHTKLNELIKKADKKMYKDKKGKHRR